MRPSASHWRHSLYWLLRTRTLNCSFAPASGRTPNPCAVCNPKFKFGKLQEFARSLNTDRSFTELGDKVLLLPVCQRVSDNPKYNVLFRDSALSEYILSLLYRQERDHQIRELMKYDLTEKEADMLFTYLLTGAFAVNKAMRWKKDKDWLRVQQIILNFVSSGMDGLKKM